MHPEKRRFSCVFLVGAPGMGNNYKVKDQNALGSRKR